jgi:hypothetical protein
MLTILAASALLLLDVAHAAPSADKIKSLPGWDAPLPSAHYSGYLNASGRRLTVHWGLHRRLMRQCPATLTL